MPADDPQHPVSAVKVVLHGPLDEQDARAIVAGGAPRGLAAAADYPAEGERIGAGMFLERVTVGEDPRPFGAFAICLEDPATGGRTAIGGIGFHGAVDQLGAVEIGYGLAPSQRGKGYAKAALRLLIEYARVQGVRLLTAETEPTNAPSEAVLQACGFRCIGAEERTVFYEYALR